MKIKDSIIRLFIFCLFLVITYHFIFLPLGLTGNFVRAFNDRTTLTSYHFLDQEKSDIVIVDINDESINALGIKWPWPRSQFAKLLQVIDNAGAAVIVFDVVFAGESSLGPDDDRDFKNALDLSKKVILASYINEKGQLTEPTANFYSAASEVGFVNKLKDDDYVVRKAIAAARFDNGLIDYSFEIKTKAFLEGVSSEKIEFNNGQIIINDKNRAIPVEKGGSLPIFYRYKLDDFNHIPVIDVLNRDFKKDIFKDKVVLIGQTAEILHDVYSTPLGHMDGVVVAANLMQQLIDEKILKPVDTFLSVISVFVIAFILGCAAFYLPITILILLSIIVFLLIFTWSVFLYRAGFLLDVFSFVGICVVTFVAVAFYKYAQFLIDKQRLLNIAVRDEGTGFFNRHYLQVHLKQELKKPVSKRRPLSIWLISIDNFDKLLDRVSIEKLNALFLKLNTIFKKLLTDVGIIARFTDNSIVVISRSKSLKAIKITAEDLYKKAGRLSIETDTQENRLEHLDIALTVLINSADRDLFVDNVLFGLSCSLLKAQEQQNKKLHIGDMKKECLSIEPDKEVLASEKDIIGFAADDLKEKNNQLNKKIKELGLYHKKIQEAYFSSLRALLEALEEKDSYTSGHSLRVAGYSLMIGKQINLNQEKLDLLEKAAMLHDIGKIGLSDNLLHKKEKLTDEDFAMIKKHELISVKILKPIDFLKDALPIILHHHERYDGSGYPHGLRGEMIPLEARIIAVADAFDAMTTGRGYNKSMSDLEAIEELERCSNKQLDSLLVDAFIQALKREKN